MGPLILGPKTILCFLVWTMCARFVVADVADKKFKGLYTNKLADAHETIPVKLDPKGNHLSNNLTHFHKDSNETLQINISIYAIDHHLLLKPSTRFLAPNFLFEWRGKQKHIRKKPSKESQNCHYQGVVHGDSNSMVAISTCNGLAGVIQTKQGKFYVEPSHHPEKSVPSGHKHLIYKRSAVINYIPDSTPKKPQRKKSRHRSSCGTKTPKGYTRLEWQKRGSKINLKKKKTSKKNKHSKYSARHKRSVSKPQYVETLVVADSSMVKFHQDGDIETYLLTLMNMVSSFYQDPSIGNYINVVVVKIILLDDFSEEPEFEVNTDADNTLKNFCKWQKDINAKYDSHPQHHDVAILLTRRDICAKEVTQCGTLGVAHIGGMCKASKSCSVNEDNGITAAHTIAHEMGHNFGMLHDSERNGCKRTTKNKLHVMAPTFEADIIDVSWSNCSKRDITNFLDKGLGKCLQDEPEESEEYQYPDLPAGAIYNANSQCRFQFGSPDAVLCTQLEDICSRLWCSVNDSCTTLLRPAAQGTNCGKHKWCQDQKCIPIMDKPVPIDGGWGEWSSWSECSRTCGGGVSIMSRECDHPVPAAGGKFCVGERQRYRMCNTDPCSKDEPSYRSLQCSWYDNQTYEGKKYEWKPFYNPDNPCHLYCTDAGNTMVVPWGNYAADGTPCNIVSKDICVSGICKKVGCDWVVDSTAKEDECGICEGDGTKCDIIKGEFNKQSASPGYREIVVIPTGARNIKIQELDQSENYIALENAYEKKFYLNGKRHITLPGEYNVAGAPALYERDHNLEKIHIPGPTHEPLLVSLFFRGKTYNPGVSWKYSSWRPEITKQVKYDWILEDWSQCSSTCGGGVQKREPLCQEQIISPVSADLESPNIVAEEMCDFTLKPQVLERICNEDPCPYKWWVGPWQSCPVSCYVENQKPIKKRSVMCVNGQDLAMPDHYCDKNTKPHEVKMCETLPRCEEYAR